MTKRRPSDPDVPDRPLYKRRVGEGACDHMLAPHVAYDMQGSGYRAVLHCRCTTVKIEGQKVRPTYLQAEIDSAAMMEAMYARTAAGAKEADV